MAPRGRLSRLCQRWEISGVDDIGGDARMVGLLGEKLLDDLLIPSCSGCAAASCPVGVEMSTRAMRLMNGSGVIAFIPHLHERNWRGSGTPTVPMRSGIALNQKNHPPLRRKLERMKRCGLLINGGDGRERMMLVGLEGGCVSDLFLAICTSLALQTGTRERCENAV